MNRRFHLAVLVAIGLGLPALATPGAPTPAAKTSPATPAKAAAPAAKTGPAAPAPAAAPAAKPAAGETTYAFLQAPLFSDAFGSTPVATVEDQTITLRDLTDALAGAHGAHQEEARAGKKDFTPILDRLIEARLMVLEAREMGIDELPEYKKALEEFRTAASQEILKEKATDGVAADPAEVDRIYKASVCEWKVSTVLLDRADYAKEIAAALKAGKTFEAAAAQIAAEKKGKAGGPPADFFPRKEMLPLVVEALSGLKVGELSPPVKVQEGYAVMKVEDIRYPDDPKARADAEAASRAARKKAALTKYYTDAVKRYAKIDKGLLERLDYHAKKPGLAALEKDQRPIARIAGAKPITVADLTASLKEGFFHGMEQALKEKKVNKQKYPVFDGLLSQRILPLEVKREGIEQSEELARRVKAWESSTLFSQVIQRVILPDVKAGEPEQKKFYEAHKADYASPAMYRLESLVFKSAKEAQGAVDKLRAGTDFGWLNANADGQVKPADRKTRLEGVLASTALPPDVAKVLAGTKKGDLRLYQEPATSYYHAVRVVDVIPGGQTPFEEVQGSVQQRVFSEAISDGIHAYAAKLRKARDVKVYLTRIGG